MHAGPVMGVALSKVVALGIGGICVWTRRTHLIRLDFVLVWRPGGVESDDHVERARPMAH